MSDVERSARARLQQVVEILQTLDGELQDIHTGLPVSDREDVMYAGEEELDFPTEARSVIECVRADWIGPAIRDLSGAATYVIPGNDAH
jgi:hypothetical protein